MQGSHCTTRPAGDTTATSASLADLVIQLKQNRKTQSTAALPTEAVNKVLLKHFQLNQTRQALSIVKPPNYFKPLYFQDFSRQFSSSDQAIPIKSKF